MEHSFTNRALGIKGDDNTTSVTARLPDEVVAFMDSLGPTDLFRNRSEFIQHWAQVGMKVMVDEDLDEALDWALDRPVQQITVGLDDYGPVTITTEALSGGEPDTEPVTYTYEPPQMSMDDRIEGTELVDLQETQLEALRSRVK